MAGELITLDYQLELRSVLMGRSTKIEVDEEGPELFGMADVRDVDVDRTEEHGMWTGAEYLTGRPLAVPLVIYADSVAEALELLADLGTAWQPSDDPIPLVFRIGGRDFRLEGKPRRMSPDLRDVAEFIVPVACEFVATDPRVYENALHSELIGLATAGGGRTYDRVYPLVYGDLSEGGRLTAVNDGNFGAPVRARISGPSSGSLVSPRIENITSGRTLSLDLSIPTGEFVDIDLDAHTILLNGTASRRGAMTPDSEWWDLQPGPNEIRFAASTFADGASLTLEWRSAWVG